MSILLYFLVTLCIAKLTVIEGTKEDTCNELEDKSPNLRLKKKLFCDYDVIERPTNDPKNKTEIRVLPIVKLAEFDDYSNALSMTTWIWFSWQDVNLKWEPKDFENLDSLVIHSDEIWTPEVTIQNSVDGYESTMLPSTKCSLSFSGDIHCVPTVNYNIKCKTDWSYWPYDVHNCSLQLGSSYHTDEEIALSEHSGTTTQRFPRSINWKIEASEIGIINKTSKFMPDTTFPVMTVTYIATRIHSQIRSVFIYPTFVITVLTLVTLWLDPGSNERLLLASINFLCHLFCIQELHWKLPLTGSTIPNIMLFYHNSLILAVLALILTCFLRYIVELEKPVPNWISSYVSIILSSRAGQILLLSILDPKASAIFEDEADDNNDLVNSDPKKSTWNYVVILLGWISFFSFSLIYIIMFTVYIRTGH